VVLFGEVSPGGVIGGYPLVMVDTRREGLEFYGKHADDLTRFATSLVGPDAAGDVVADAVMRVIAAPVWSIAENPLGLLYRAVLFEAGSWRRAEGRRRDREQRAARLQGTAAVATETEADPAVWAAMDELSRQQRAVVFLTYWEDLSPLQVAERLGVSEGSVRKQLARARERLRRRLS
jgi:RNA polymerase sigma factor (sigma-70 family)